MAKSALCAFVAALSICTIQAQNLDLSNDDDWYTNMYLNLPIVPKFHVYFFNLTNPEQFLGGAKPVFQEVGPYVYTENWERDNVKFKKGGNEIEFVPKQIYRFNPRLSKGNRQTDIITTLNIPFITALHQMRYGDSRVSQAIGSLLDIFKEGAYVSRNVRQLMWGYENRFIKLGKSTLPPGKRYPYDKFGLFVGRNDTDQGSLTISTGKDGRSFFGQIMAYNNRKELPFWQSGSQCSNVVGTTDGFVFKPNIDPRKDVLRVFNRNICRSLGYVFDSTTKDNYGNDAFKFVPQSNAFGTVDENSSTRCYCTDTCNQISGIFNISSCNYDAPIMLSWPHFFQADPKLKADVVGLNPIKEKHQPWFLVHPKKGTSLAARAKGQINIALESVPGVEQAKGLRKMIFPIMWFSDEGDGIEDPEKQSRLKEIFAKV